ncbi:dehydrogenase [Streptomyces parvulus]|uniref:Dehydrogenase n=1 Tax=Streptomyces parvulus TaxID=146923 RepID=A0A369VBV0_9ACTN|nr:dehydrogenase [Streptomyces parvulus]
MSSSIPACPECRQPMYSGGLILSKRQDDGRRTCRSLWRCARGVCQRHVWWRWVDRPDGPLEICPVPERFR